MADIKWSSFPATTGTSPGDSLVGLHSGANERFLVSNTPSASGVALWDANSNLSANNTINGYATTVTAAGTTTLTVASKYQQYFTGSTTQTVVMPVTSTLVTGQSWLIVNNSSGNVTVNASDSSLILTMTPNTQAVITCISTSFTSNAGWNNQYVLNQLTPSSSNANISSTNVGGIADYGNDIYSLSYQSYFVFNSFYQNLLCMAYSASGISLATINFGNVQALTSSFTPNFALLTSISFPSLLFSLAGGITLNTPSLTTFSAPNLMFLSASFTLTNTALTTLSLPSYTGTGNSLVFTASASLATISLPVLRIVFGISGTLPALTTFTLTSLQVMGSYTLTANALTTLDLPALLSIGSSTYSFTANFAPAGTSLATINMPLLTQVNGTFSPTLAALTTLTLTNLQSVTGAFGLTAASLTTLSMPALTTLGAGFSPVCAAATTVTLTLLSSITGAVAASFASLATLSLPALTTVTSTFTITAANLVTFSMNTGLLNIGGNFTMTGMKLNQASVDGILVRLAALDGTGGTTSYNNRTVNLSGGTSSAPSATGLTAKATLQARGCTVTTN